jgi:UDP-2-acetamido-3-amino-2,3-dideoxy-glucuronate N-acetyltransferase
VGNDVLIGNRVKIQNNVSVYDAVTLEDDVFCGPAWCSPTSTTRARHRAQGRIPAHLVRRGATIGANATIVCGITVGEYAFIGAGAVIKRDVPAFALMAGVPARQIGWMSRFGERLPLRTDGDGEALCPHTGDLYLLQDGVCTLTPRA